LKSSRLVFASFLILTVSACSPGTDGLASLTGTATSVASTPTSTATPTITPSPTPLACWQEGGTLLEENIPSELVFSPFEFLIYLPPCYDYEPDRYYPVLYLIHGQSFTHDQWDRLGADEVSDALIASGEVASFILVMPRVIDWAEPPEAKFGQAMVEELIPYIDAHYRTNPEREVRAVGGLSRGAAWAIHLGLESWEFFGTWGAHSLPIFQKDALFVQGWVEAIPEKSFPRIYIDMADQDLKGIRRSTEWFINLLTEKELPYQFFVFPGIHNEEYWGAHVKEYIRFYAGEW
jgi:enterochelin esterase-like enzyme